MTDIHSIAAAFDQFIDRFDFMPSRWNRIRSVHDRIGRKARRLKADCVSLYSSVKYFRLGHRALRVLGEVHDPGVLSKFFPVEEFDPHVNRTAERDLLIIFICYADIQQFDIFQGVLIAVDHGGGLLHKGIVLSVRLCQLSDQQFGVAFCHCLRVKSHRDLIGASVRSEDRRCDRLCSYNSVNGELLRLELDSLDLAVFCLVSLGFDLGFEDLGALLFLLSVLDILKVDRVHRCLFRNLKRFLVLDAHLHFACRLDFFAVIYERDVIEPGKRQFRFLVVLVLYFAQGLRVVLLVNFRVFLLSDLLNLELYAHRQFRGHAKIGVDIIVLAFEYKLRVLCDQFNLRSGFDDCFGQAFFRILGG